MKTSKIEIALAVAALLSGAILVSFYTLSYPKTADASASQAVYGVSNNGGVLCGNASSTLMVATSTSGRQLAYISNDSPFPVYLGFGKDVRNDTGVLLNASSTIKFDSSGSYGGSIYCSAQGGVASTTFSDSRY